MSSGRGWQSVADALGGRAALKALAQEFRDRAETLGQEDGWSVPPPTAADGQPWCARCQGARWLRQDVALGDPRFAALTRCPDCLDTQVAAIRQRVAARSHLSDRQQSKTFERFAFVPEAREAVDAAAAFARAPRGWLVIHGLPGSGKTHLGLAITNALIREAASVRWFYVPDLLDDARRLMREHAADDLQTVLADTEVLVLDELGKAKPTDYAVDDFLEPLCDRRYRDGAATVFTMIGKPQDIKELVSESIGRRLQDAELCTVVHNAAPQWGLKGASQ